MHGKFSFGAMRRFAQTDKDSEMDIKTLLLYAAIACGGAGTSALVVPHFMDKPLSVSTCDESGNIQRKGPPPRVSQHQGF